MVIDCLVSNFNFNHDDYPLCSIKAGEMIVIRVSCSDNDVAKGYVVCDEVRAVLGNTVGYVLYP